MVWAQSGSERIVRVMMYIHSQQFWQWFEFIATQLCTWIGFNCETRSIQECSQSSAEERFKVVVSGACWHLLLCFYADYNVFGSGALWHVARNWGTRSWSTGPVQFCSTTSVFFSFWTYFLLLSFDTFKLLIHLRSDSTIADIFSQFEFRLQTTQTCVYTKQREQCAKHLKTQRKTIFISNICVCVYLRLMLIQIHRKINMIKVFLNKLQSAVGGHVFWLKTLHFMGDMGFWAHK